MLYCYGQDGKLALVRPTAAGYEIISFFEITKGDGLHWAHPAISNGRLYIRHGDAVMVYDIRQRQAQQSRPRPLGRVRAGRAASEVKNYLGWLRDFSYLPLTFCSAAI